MDEWEDRAGGDPREFALLSRDELEAKVRSRTETLENVMDTMVDVLLRLSPEGRIVMANDSVESILGYDPETVVGKPLEFLLAEEDATGEEIDTQVLELLLEEGEVTDFEVPFETADGDVIPMSLSASIMTDDDGFTGCVCVAKDVSDRVAAQERAEFLHSLLRHDLGNALQVFSGYVNLLEEQSDELSPESRTAVEKLSDTVADAMDLVEKVRSLNRIDSGSERDTVALASVLRTAVERNDGLAEQADIEVSTPADVSVQIVGSPLLGELFHNLLENSLKHSDGSQVAVSVTEATDTVTVTVTDDGRGLPDNDPEQILERGFKGPDSSGTGLGMYLARRIAEAHGGSIAVGESDMGGARFEVTLPTD